MYPLLKSILLLSCAAMSFYSTRPPNPPPKDQEVAYKGQAFERIVRSIVTIWQVTFFSSILGHVAVMLALCYQEYGQVSSAALNLLPYICANPSPSLPNLSALTPTFLSGIAVLIAGGALRLWCYDTLGRHFTFEVTILNDHALITSGPYAFIRHPSYTGSFMITMAATVIFFGSDGYLAGCNVQDTRIGWFVQLWKFLVPYSIWSMIKRARVEDDLLKQKFGAKWEVYRQQVPYRFIPYLV